VDDQRAKIEFLAYAIQQRAIERRRWGGAPHARASGEDLEGIRAEFLGFKRGFFQRPLACSVDSDPQNFIVASWA
jgi:hypothetical protein